MPRRQPPELDIDVALSGSRCFEGEEVTITATVGAALPLDEIIIELKPCRRPSWPTRARACRPSCAPGGPAPGG